MTDDCSYAVLSARRTFTGRVLTVRSERVPMPGGDGSQLDVAELHGAVTPVDARDEHVPARASDRPSMSEGAAPPVLPVAEVDDVRSLSGEQGPGRPVLLRLRGLEMVGPYAVVGVALITAALVTWGPAPHAQAPTTEFSEPGLAEPTDRLLVLAWWVWAIVLALALEFAGRGRLARRLDLSDGTRRAVGGGVSVAAVAAGITVASVGWRSDVTGLWLGLPLRGAVVGAVVAAVIAVVLVARGRRVWITASAVVATVALPFGLLLWFQLPGAVRDPFHFVFTSDEIAAVAARHVPLGDYIPQYSVLLGYPVGALDFLWPGHVTLLVLAWLLLLQVVSVVAAVTLSVQLGGWRMLVPAAVVVIAPTVAALLGTGLSASTYFSVLPMRVVLPVCTILGAFLVLRRGVSSRRWWHWTVVGLLVGATALNNPDYGLPAALAVAVTLWLVAGGWAAAWRPLVVLAAATVVVFVAYDAFGRMTGNPIRWSSWLTFQLIFGAQGFSSIPVALFGVHIAVIGLFVTASVIGFVLVRTRPAASWSGRQGIALCLVGGWSLLTIPYFAGRSLPPTVIGGYAFSVGLVIACLLPLLRMSLRSLRTGRVDGRVGRMISIGLGLVSVAGAVGAAVLAVPPATLLGWLQIADRQEFPPVTAQIASVRTVAGTAGNEELARALADGQVVQALPMSNLVAVNSGIGSASVASSDAYFGVSRVFTTAQCELKWPGGASFLLVTSDVADALQRDPVCASYVSFTDAADFSDDAGTTFTLLPRAVTPGAS